MNNVVLCNLLPAAFDETALSVDTAVMPQYQSINLFAHNQPAQNDNKT